MLSVPALSVAPVGTPETTTASDSEPSVSDRVEVMSSAIAVSSVPEALATVRFGASASAATETSMVSITWLVSLPSVAVAVTVRVKSASEFAAGVTVRPVS